MKIPTVVRLPGKDNYAVMSTDRIVFALDASDSDLSSVFAEEEKIYKTFLENHNVNRTVKVISERSTSIALIPTMDCNLKCIYCYARGGDEKNIISFELAQKAIRSIGPACGFKHLDLYLVGGGEPLLKFDIVKQIVSFAESTFESVRLHIVSNGTFEDEVINWLTNKDCRVRISFDGAMQSVQRPYRDYVTPTALKVKKNIAELVKRGVPVIVQCIVTNESLGCLRDTVSEISKLGVKVIKIEPMLATAISRGSKSLMPNPIKYADALLDTIRFVADTDMDMKIDTAYFSAPSESPFCGMGYGNKTITPEGLITACVEVVRSSDPYAEQVIYGKMTDKGMFFDAQKLETLKSVNPTSTEACEACNLRLICHGGCPMANIWQTGFKPSRSIFTCAVEKRLLPNLLLEIATNPRVSKTVLENTEISLLD